MRTAVQIQRWTLIGLLLAAWAIRVIGLVDQSPPGLSHDEVANWLIDRSILEGNHAVYFTEAYGHEAGFHYWQAALIGLIGDSPFVLRIASAYLGLLATAVAYTLVRRIYGREVALLSAAVVGFLFWPVFFSRQALRAIMLPVTAGLSLYFWWGWRQTDARRDLIWATLWAGLSTYTYLASRALPIFFVGLFVYELVLHRKALVKQWRGWVAFAAGYLLISLPLFVFLQTTPEAEFRVDEVSAPLQALLSGDVRPVLTNALAILGAFGWEGDPLWRHNVSGTPIFAPLMGILFYLGLLRAIWFWRDRRYAILLMWTAAAIVPSLVTIDAPSTIRMIMLLPFIGLFAADFIHKLPKLSTVFPQLSTDFVEKWWITALTIGFIFLSSGRTWPMLNQVWAQNDEVQFVWQAALTDMAAYLDESPQTQAVGLVGWTPDTMDPPTMAVTLQRDDLNIRFWGQVGEIETAVIPAGAPAEGVLLRPTVLPFAPPLEEALAQLGLTPTDGSTFVRYNWSTEVQPPQTLSETFSGQLELIYVESASTCFETADQLCQLLTYWRVQETTPDARRIFVHLVDESGNLLSQHDGLSAPAEYWQVGDLIIQLHTLETAENGDRLRIGVYDPRPPFARLRLADGREFVEID